VTLDAQTQAFLDKARANAGPPPGEVPLADFRAAVDAFRALGFDREEVTSVRDIGIPRADGPDVEIRLYIPADAGDRPLPLIVWAHGGSWVRVTVDLLDGHFRVYANRSGCAVAAVDYRLAPETRFPGALEDVYTAASWLRLNAESLGLDPSLIAIAGESSGGNVAAAVTQLDRERGEVEFIYQALLVPVLDARFATPSWAALGSDYLLTRAQLEWAIEQYAPDVAKTDALLSPLCASDLAGLPPALVVTGEFDPLRDEGAAYAEALESAGIAVEHVHYEGLIHHAVMVPRIIDLGRRVLEESATRIGSALGRTPSPTTSA
jgi:acetyl esterase/lipase